jgi:peptide/nickel transport system permease protein
MQKFLVWRLVVTLFTLIAVSMLIFGMGRVVGDPRHLLLSEYATQEDWDAVGERLGLDKPIYQQYLIYMGNMARGDFGQSIQERRPAMELVAQRLPATVQLGVAAFVLSLAIGIPLGVLSAVQRGSILDQAGKVLALIGQAAPPFWLGIMLVLLFGVLLGVLPPSGRQQPTSIILPAIALGWYFVAANLRLVRSAMLDVLDSEYIKLAKAKGVSRGLVIWKHALRNALIPPLTLAGVNLASLVTGSLVIETVFAWPGLGRLAIEALFTSDYPVLQGVVIVFTLMYVGASLLVDILYAYINPRVRYN